MLSSCRKTNPQISPMPEGKEYEIKFTTSGLAQEVRPNLGGGISTKSQNSSNQVSTINQPNTIEYLIYSMDNKLVERKTERINYLNGVPSNNGGTHKTKLLEGRYKIGIFAHSGEFKFDNSQLNNHEILIDRGFNYLIRRDISNPKETFIYHYKDFTVEKDTIYPTLKLERLNSKLEILIKDEIPSNISFITFGGNLPNKFYPFILSPQNPYQYTTPSNILFNLSNHAGKKGLILENIIQVGNKVGIIDNYTIEAFDNKFELLFSKNIKQVLFKENHITRLTGRLFDVNNDVGFKVEFIREYATKVIEKEI